MTITTDYSVTADAHALARAVQAIVKDRGGIISQPDPFMGLDDALTNSRVPSDRQGAALAYLRAEGFLVDHTPEKPRANVVHYRLVGVPEAPKSPEDVTVDVQVTTRPSVGAPSRQRPGAAEACDSVSSPSPDDDSPLPPATGEPKRKRGRPKGSGKPKKGPTPQVPWRAPKDQAEHMKAIRSSRTLKKNARLVAFDAHLQFGLESVSSKRGFSTVKKELTPEYLAMFTGLSESTCRDAMAEACKLGFFHRLDNRAGGRGDTNRATYTATVPEWT